MLKKVWYLSENFCLCANIRHVLANTIAYRARKILSLRLFEDSNEKRWAKSTSELQLEILCVSQFTLYHKLKGNKPDFRLSMGSNDSKILYEKLQEKLRVMYKSSHVKG